MPDPIKKSTTYDSSTGETTFKASWSGNNNSISRGPITPKGTNRTVASRQTYSPASKVVASRSESSGQRMAVAFKSPTAAGITEKAEIKAGNLPDKASKKLTHRDIVQIKVQKDNEDLQKQYPGMSLEDARAKRYKQSIKNAERASRERRNNWRSPNIEENKGRGGSTITNKACSSC